MTILDITTIRCNALTTGLVTAGVLGAAGNDQDVMVLLRSAPLGLSHVFYPLTTSQV